MPDKYPKVDYLFAGAGASATLMLMSMERHGLLKDKTILILDPDEKLNNDKTYCFWSPENEQPFLQCRHLISHQWEEISVNRKEKEPLYPLKYVHISSLDLYKEQRRIIEQYNLQRITGSVSEILSTQRGIKVVSTKGTWESDILFDSRPPKYLPLKKEDVHLSQSFLGYVISTENPLENANCVDLMDFNVEQQGYTQFMYVLPYGSNKALVELTRFGMQSITQQEAEPVLHEYITERFGNYEICNIETGCIPMSTAGIITEEISGVIPIGTRAGAVKSSTGYAFKNMFFHADQLSDCLKKNQPPQKISRASRFGFYDRLLLLILSRQPAQGKLIFQSLFKKNNTTSILKFLDEQTTLYNDVRIFATLPLKPFLNAVFWVIEAKLIKYIKPIALLLITLALWVLHTFAPSVFDNAQLIIFLTGLIFLGIPHGAVDHLLDTNNIKGRIKLNFIINYLGLAVINLFLWLIFPVFALIFFLLYTAWHFGQTDMTEWKLHKMNVLKNLVWGISILSIIIIGHADETNPILLNMIDRQIPLSVPDGKLIGLLLGLSSMIWALLERSWMMVLSAVLLTTTIQLPLITAFGLYFIGQHSMNGWSHLKKGMMTSDIALFREALPFTAGAFLLFGILYYFQSGILSSFKGHWLTIFFVFISCISFPHVMAMSKFYKGRISQQ